METEKQKRFSVEVPKEGDILRPERHEDGYVVKFVNQFGFEVLDIPEGTTVKVSPVSMGIGGMPVIGHAELTGVITHKDGKIYFVDERGENKFWNNDEVKIISLPK